MLAAAALGLGCIQLGVVLPGSGDVWWAHVLFAAVFWVYVAAGILAWLRRPSNRIGALLVFGGFMVFAASLANTDIPGIAAFGTVCATAVFAVTIHLLLAFPAGRLRTRASRATVVAAYVVSFVLQAPLYLFDKSAPSPLSVADRADLLLVGEWVQRAAGALVVVATAVILAQRLKRADAAHFRVLGPLFAYGMLAVLTISLRSFLLENIFGLSPLAGATVQLVVFGGIPIAFTLGVLRGGFARTGALDELGTWLGATGAARLSLVDALAQALGDNSVQIVFWVPEQKAWVDSSGTQIELPGPQAERASVELELAGARIGAIVYDAALNDDPDVVRAAGRVIAIAAEHERLLAELRASQDALWRSRARLVAAADRERRRIARDLHDGIQVRLVLLALEAQQIANAPESALATARQATALRVGIDAAAAELRRLVHDVMPSTLIERGLAAATEDLVDRMPVPTSLYLNITDGRLSERVESTAYFVIAEGLANALKHAKAQKLDVRVERAGDRLFVEVADDGTGGAALSVGNGLRGLADRVDVLGGRFHLDSELGVGTRLAADLPCAS
ncbi:signal transduction histidine kinase [Antricoccus suffuscus]|uniref:histidine kinase n=2 Tax=Antricoccus suffuscus TaxID=1629062 RepID=A0A2T0ZY87_9ACTN|nr:signal transduction histidine kinase [Antricoccus suffuscus]